VFPGASLTTTPRPIPLMSGPWFDLADDEAKAVLERLSSVLDRSHGPAAFSKRLPISGLRALALSFYPGWLLLEGEAQLTASEYGTFNVLYGPGLMWVIDGESKTIHDLNAGLILEVTPKPDGEEAYAVGTTSPSFVSPPLIELDTTTTGPDYLRFFCGSVWGDEGPFLLVESADAAVLDEAEGADQPWRKRIGPVRMKRAGDHLIGEAVVGYAGALFAATFKVQGSLVTMENDEPLTGSIVPKPRNQTPFRNVRSGTLQAAGTRGES
jgi:hypothetical protein